MRRRYCDWPDCVKEINQDIAMTLVTVDIRTDNRSTHKDYCKDHSDRIIAFIERRGYS